MIGWLKLTKEQRKTVIDQAEQLSGITAKAIEKDWWVTLTLKAMFQSKFAKNMVFKGGTSLSKGWNLIARFSEDIDIALEPEAFDMKYVEAPSQTYVQNLKKKGSKFISTVLLEELRKKFKDLGVPDNTIIVEAEPIPIDRTDVDPQAIYVIYPSLYEKNTYITDMVKIEVSVRSLRMPFASRPLQSLLHAINPTDAYKEESFQVDVVEPRKTFLEKIFLLHEEFSKPDKTKIRTERMSRHLYDLNQLMKASAGEEGINDQGLYEHLIRHRELYNKIRGIDYTTHTHDKISFLPSLEVIENYSKDYATMREQMIYEEAASFEEILTNLKLLQGKIRFKHEHLTLDEIIETGKRQISSSDFFADKLPNNGAKYTTQIVLKSDPALPASNANKSIIYGVEFVYQNGELVFESVTLT